MGEEWDIPASTEWVVTEKESAFGIESETGAVVVDKADWRFGSMIRDYCYCYY